MPMSRDQEAAARGIISGEDTFLTGGGGTGKTFIVNHAVQASKRRFLRAATTGSAAMLANGVTAHSLFSIPSRVYEPGAVKNAKPDLFKLLSRVSGVTIDEVSMLRVDAFQAVIDALDETSQRFGKRPQVVLVGDFAQLSPVVTEKETPVLSHYYGDRLFAFEHERWADFAPRSLTVMHRQGKDQEFAKWLFEIRAGRAPNLDLMASRVRPGRKGGVRLVATNDKAARINNDERDELDDANEFTFSGDVSGSFPAENMRVPPKMTLPAGSRVVICANDRTGDRSYVNGTSGTLVGAGKDMEAIVDTDAGRRVIVPRTSWEETSYVPVTENGELYGYEAKTTGTYRQTPIIPGWAITIHRSQGMSLDDLHVDLRGVFAHGQAYVALSRATSLAGLTLETPLTGDEFMNDPRVMRYHAEVLGA